MARGLVGVRSSSFPMRRVGYGLGVGLVIVCRIACTPKGADPAVDAPAPEISVRALDGERRQLRLGAGDLAPRRITVEDPNRGGQTRYDAVPMDAVMARAFGDDTRGRTFAVRAKDGYVRRLAGERLASGAAHLALRDAASPGFAPLEEAGDVDPGPLYLVWTGTSAASRPWVWSVSAIEEIAPERWNQAVDRGRDP